MRSIKPGRGPSAMGAAGSLFTAVFGVIWTIGAASMGAPSFFVLFGVVFIIMAIVQAVYHFNNATGKNRMSEYDITDPHEEPDPLNERFGSKQRRRYTDDPVNTDPGEINYCPYCGNRIAEESHRFCANCGREIGA
ncbi:zinc ribbon domain-containing protein [Cohnella sp. CFH 77786]|uniref:zinc ribbon domain-containing protein n=1 Tax=Cohnella sp. CFH 77786 TaxID=2662265 RepID=UPI001C60884D|nr:zinc ribbon domain-containing protein [Cohnella sp. CFH 77786]MBW5445345.1 zinc ribbon domain-containing protein [Cohnella sp. CFH 77786]